MVFDPFRPIWDQKVPFWAILGYFEPFLALISTNYVQKSSFGQNFNLVLPNLDFYAQKM